MRTFFVAMQQFQQQISRGWSAAAAEGMRSRDPPPTRAEFDQACCLTVSSAPRPHTHTHTPTRFKSLCSIYTMDKLYTHSQAHGRTLRQASWEDDDRWSKRIKDATYGKIDFLRDDYTWAEARCHRDAAESMPRACRDRAESIAPRFIGQSCCASLPPAGAHGQEHADTGV